MWNTGHVGHYLGGFFAEMHSVWGAAGYAQVGPYAAITARLAGQFGAWGRWVGFLLGEGARSGWWPSQMYGRGTMRPKLGLYIDGTSPATDQVTELGDGLQEQWLGGCAAVFPVKLYPRYALRVRFTLLNINVDGTHNVQVQVQHNGPGVDGDSTFQTSWISNTKEWPCASCGFSVFSGNDNTVEFNSLSVWPISYGDCVVEPEPQEHEVLEKAWIFTLDGHTFYVLNRVEGKTLVYDMTTGQWQRWFTGYRPFRNMFRGIMWKGRVIAADRLNAKVWELDPYSELDEEITDIQRAVSGFLAIRGKERYRQGSMRVTASVGFPNLAGSQLQMRFSDDGGNTWVGPFNIEIEDGELNQEIKYRSLGAMRAPGRIWEFYDVGGLLRIDGVDSTHE